MKNSKALLVILDGFGIAENPTFSAVDKANKPFYDSLLQRFPHSQLSASGEDVGLPDGQFGNSEVGHLNIGAGRIVWQALSRINKDIREGTFFHNKCLLNAIEAAKPKNKIHLMGLFSDGGVHSHNDHLYALLKLCKNHGIENVYVHAFTDGRDTAPTSGKKYAQEFLSQADNIGVGELASLVGRYYIMDRDNRWERVQKGYDLLVNGIGKFFDNAIAAFNASYQSGITDEFLNPVLLNDDPNSRIQENDSVIFYNIRGDRAREITRSLIEDNFNEFEITKDLQLHYSCFTQYDATFEHVFIAYPPQILKNTLGEWVSIQGLTQFRIAETEKYPHVTYFFNGGEETPYLGEDRTVIPSPKVATYNLQPEMSAPKVGDALVEQLSKNYYDLVILNFANPDMVGHTGDMQATKKAIEAVDIQLKRIVKVANENDYRTLIIADHGNSDQMLKMDGSPHTAHTTAPVPCILINFPEKITLKEGILADVAPTLLKMMTIEQPEEMTGTPLF